MIGKLISRIVNNQINYTTAIFLQTFVTHCLNITEPFSSYGAPDKTGKTIFEKVKQNFKIILFLRNIILFRYLKVPYIFLLKAVDTISNYSKQLLA